MHVKLPKKTPGLCMLVVVTHFENNAEMNYLSDLVFITTVNVS